MDQISYSSSCNIAGSHEYLYPNQSQSPLAVPLPSVSSHNPYTVTPPESLASGVRDFGHEDVGRLSDVLEDERERLEDSVGEDIAEIKDVILLEDTSGATTTHVSMVNVCPNKISLCEEDPRTASRGPSLTAQIYLKDVMKDIWVNISTTGNVPELMVLEGANGGVVIHKTVIAYYSKLVKEQLTDYPDCSIVYLPNYSQKILRKVVEILYTGETFYSEEEKKDVNLIWDAMRQLQISFNDKGFFYHPVEYTAVKEDVDSEDSQQDQSITILNGQVEVDQTDECWHEDQTTNHTTDALSYCRVVRQPHPANPSRSVYIHSKYGEGRKIQRSMPALAHVNADEIQEREKIENRKLTEQLLQKHKPIIIDLLEEDEEDKDDGSSPNKKIRTQTYVTDTSVIRDNDFKNLVASGKVKVNMVKAATLASQQQIGETCDDQHQLGKQPSPEENQESHTMLQIVPGEALPMQSSIMPSVIIPPNRPEGTGIAFVQKSPGSFYESISEMPKLHRVADHDHHQIAPKRTRKNSADITDIPKLDRICDVSGPRPLIRDNKSDDVTGTVKTGHVIPGLATAALVPVSKLNQFMISQSTNFTLTDMTTEPQPGTSKILMGSQGRKVRNTKQPKAICPMTGVEEEELKRMKEEYRKQEQRKVPVIVVGSKKKPVPDDVKVDAYVEDDNDEDVDRFYIMGDSVETAIHHLLDCRAVASRDLVPSEGVSNPDALPLSPDISYAATTRKGGRGLRRCRTQVQPTEVPVCEEDEARSGNQSETKRKIPKGKSRRGSRRGGRS